MCGNCKSCVCVNGGYQVHITCETKRDFVSDILECEFLEITNLGSDNFSYKEYITSKNFKDLLAAQEYMVSSYEILKMYTCIPVRMKIESHPSNEHKFLYKEIHYKFKKEDAFDLACAIARQNKKYFYSRNNKGSMFATARFFPGQPIDMLDFPHRIEDVIFDSNLELDNKLLGYRG